MKKFKNFVKEVLAVILLILLAVSIILSLASVAYIYYGVIVADDGWNLFNLIPVFIIVLMVIACFD